jgi:hypothetical protein
MNDITAIKFDPKTVIYVEEPLVNSYGLDLTYRDYLKYTRNDVTIEVIGGIKDVVLTTLKVTLKLYKEGNTSSMEVYRCQQIDLFNEHQLEHLIRNASERIRVERTKVKETLYELAERLERYRIDKTINAEKPEVNSRISATETKNIKKFLKQKDLLNIVKSELEKAGVVDSELGLKLFLLSLTRTTDSPIHAILQGNLLTCNELIKSIVPIIPQEQLREATSISKNALSYPPYPNYWQQKTLVLHRLNASLGIGSLLEEYIQSGGLKRIITEDNHNVGTRRSGEKNNMDSFGILGYTDKDFYPVFNSHNVVCLPLPNIKELKDKLYDFEIRKHAGLIDEEAKHQSTQLLINIQRFLRPLKVLNSYFDQINFEPFFNGNLKQLRLFIQLTNIITLLHQEQLFLKKKDNRLCIEVQPQHMITALELFSELWLNKDEELYFQVLGTFQRLKAILKKDFANEQENIEFFAKEYRAKLKMSPSTYAKHIKILDSYGKIKRVGGNNRTGYKYSVASWENETDSVTQYNELLEQLKSLKSI